MKRTPLMVWLPLLVAACAVSRVDPLSVPLNYAQNPKYAGVSGALACTALSQLQVSDARSDKTLGVRVHESQPLKADVTAGSDPGVWVQHGMQTVLTQNGVIFQDKGPQLLRYPSTPAHHEEASGIDPATRQRLQSRGA
jgi:hypothetical protein